MKKVVEFVSEAIFQSFLTRHVRLNLNIISPPSLKSRDIVNCRINTHLNIMVQYSIFPFHKQML